jgi:oligopeptidase A
MNDHAIADDNPLLDFRGPPRFRDLRPEHITPALDWLLAENRRRREALLAEVRHPSWENFVQPLEDMNERLHRLWSVVSHLHAVMDNEPLRRAYNEGVVRVTDYYTELQQDERLYAGFRAVAESAAFAGYDQAQRKLIENRLRDFRLAGAELPPEAKRRFGEIQRELAALETRFEQNVLDATQGWALYLEDAESLAGLPESARALAREQAAREGRRGWKFTLQAPSYLPFMMYAERRELRQRMYEAYVTRASELGPNAGRWDNGPVMLRILALRHEAARLLGFAHYAEYALQKRMAKHVGQVMDFLHELAARARPAAEREYAELAAFARAVDGIERLEAWDVPYYSEKLRQRRYALSQEELRPYFPVERVLAGLFEIARRLYGLEIVPWDNPDVWHPDVRGYEIRDHTGQVRGRFYTDLHARAHKRSGAWMAECASRRRTAEGVEVPLAFLVCNFSPPIEERPALLTHEEVTTLFHEFGHGLHHLLTTVDYPGVAGLNGVAWDVVELPSQFMENWCWEREALDLIAAHWQTGERLPEALYEKLVASRHFQAGMQFVRQLEFALFDMRLHSAPPPDSVEAIQSLLDEVRREVAVVIPPPFNRFQHSFTHIFAGGYAAGYYSYKWAEVLSADAFSKFEENGIFDRRTGLEFLHHVLEPGGTREPMEMFVAFRGREPKVDALLRHAGLAG